MGLIVIPHDYVEGVSPVVPIVVPDHDPIGKPIATGWIQGVVQAADGLRSLARYVLLDEWRSSELAEETLQALHKKHGTRLGARPDFQVYQDAKWRARDKSAGGSRTRKKMDIELLDEMLSELPEPTNLANHLEAKQRLDCLIELLEEQGRLEAVKIIQTAQHSGELAYVSDVGESTDTVYKRFWRTIRKAIRDI